MSINTGYGGDLPRIFGRSMGTILEVVETDGKTYLGTVKHLKIKQAHYYRTGDKRWFGACGMPCDEPVRSKEELEAEVEEAKETVVVEKPKKAGPAKVEPKKAVKKAKGRKKAVVDPITEVEGYDGLSNRMKNVIKIQRGGKK